MDKAYTDCYIAFLDILGFKKMIESKQCNQIYEIYSKNMRKHLQAIYRGRNLLIDINDITMKVMSDSICIYVDSSKPNALFGLIMVCQYFQAQLLKLNDEPILARGAIVRGKLFSEGDIIFGPGFVNAYLMEENNAKYPRIIMTKDTIDSAVDKATDDTMDLIWNSTFRDFDAFYTIDYLELFQGEDKENKHCQRVLEHIDSILNSTLDASVREKYLYLRQRLLVWYKQQKK